MGRYYTKKDVSKKGSNYTCGSRKFFVAGPFLFESFGNYSEQRANVYRRNVKSVIADICHDALMSNNN